MDATAVHTFAIVGPESSGKTTLTKALAQHYATIWVKEFAREALERGGPRYGEPDLLRFAAGQQDALNVGLRAAQEHRTTLLFCDTDFITFRIWSMEVFGHCHPVIEQLAEQVAFDHWFLCKPDVPWEPDPLRANPFDRDRLFTLYEAMLTELGKPYTILVGDRDQRLRTAAAMVERVRHLP